MARKKTKSLRAKKLAAQQLKGMLQKEGVYLCSPAHLAWGWRGIVYWQAYRHFCLVCAWGKCLVVRWGQTPG
ncbi:hypothetical protein O59_004104 [Cellvibrio sp. BR]|nr:hypothetical protein O59_004104 [Cellvibrio sp. BR]